VRHELDYFLQRLNALTVLINDLDTFDRLPLLSAQHFIREKFKISQIALKAATDLRDLPPYRFFLPLMSYTPMTVVVLKSITSSLTKFTKLHLRVFLLKLSANFAASHFYFMYYFGNRKHVNAYFEKALFFGPENILEKFLFFKYVMCRRIYYNSDQI